MDLAGRGMLVTGGEGFLGKHLVRAITARGEFVSVPARATYDLRDAAQARAMLDESQPQVVWHLAARCGGIGANERAPATFFHDNIVMGANVLEAARVTGVEKVVLVGTTCSYPAAAPVPLDEESLWDGYPEETNAAYGIAKRALLTMAQAYARQHWMCVPCPILANLYGPGDHFETESSHVIPAMIRKFVEAVDDELPVVTLWGTGKPTREFLHVADAARALLLVAEKVLDEQPVNIPGGPEISIGDLADLIAGLVGYGGAIEWDHSRPDGQRRRALSGGRAWRVLGYEPSVPLNEGLRDTIAWYRAQRNVVPVAVPEVVEAA